jgi:hypothetical protein
MTSEGLAVGCWQSTTAGSLQASEPFWAYIPHLRGALGCLHGHQCISHMQHGKGHWALTTMELAHSDYLWLRRRLRQRLLQEVEAFPLRLCLQWLAQYEQMSPKHCQVLAGGWAAETYQLRHCLGNGVPR